LPPPSPLQARNARGVCRPPALPHSPLTPVSLPPSPQAAWAKTDDKPAVIILGGAALVALIAASAVANAVDHVPILSDLLRLEGLVVSGWFTYRYLAFKPDREALLRSVDAYLAKVLGK